MRVFLVSSNLYSQFPAVFPNALGSLAAWLKQRGHQVDTLHMEHRRQLRRELPRRLEAFAPDVVGVSLMTCETPILEPVVVVARRITPRAQVLVGGIHCIVDPDSVARTPGVDAVCCGEGEVAFAEYLDRLERGDDVTTTGNFAFLRDGEVVRNPPQGFVEDLDTLPPMDRSVADLQYAIDANNFVLNLIFSRGCPWSCRFCCNEDIRQAGTGKYSRLLSVDRAMEEIQRLSDRYRFRYILFRDDTFTWDRDWALAFLEAYRERFTTPFDVFSRVDCLDEEIMDALAAAGCGYVFLGLDSGNDYIRNDVLNKEQDNTALMAVCEYMKSIGLIPMISNIVGLPHETPQMFRDTVELNKRIHADQVVFSPTCGACPKIWVFTPWPGSDLYRMCEAAGWIEHGPGRRKVYRETTLRMPGFSPQQIEREFRTFRYQVYKDNFPVRARLFRVYDSRWFQALFERVPTVAIGRVRQTVLDVMHGVDGKRDVRKKSTNSRVS